MNQTSDVELITNEVQMWIKSFLKDIEFKNYTLDISPGSIKGDNYLGIIAKVQVKGESKDGKNTTLNLIVKSAPRNELFRSFAPIHKVYDREIYIYSKVLPEFTKLQKERGILNPFSSFAKYYKSTMEDMNEALIMEDMKELGFILRNRHEPLDYNHTMLVMREYGKLHALSYAMRDQKPEMFNKLNENTEDAFFEGWANSVTMVKSVQEQSVRAINSLDLIKHKIAYEKFKNFQENMFEHTKELVSSESAGKYAVINHGDSWVNNMLFKYGNSEKPHTPTGLCILDWQLSRLGSPALDLSHFLFTCTDKDLRDQHYDDLIQEYYNSLTSFLRELGSEPAKLLPFEVLQQHLKKFSCYGLFMAVMVLYFIASDTDEIPDIHSLTDEDDALEKFKFETKNMEKYNSRMRGVILDLVKYNYDF